MSGNDDLLSFSIMDLRREIIKLRAAERGLVKELAAAKEEIDYWREGGLAPFRKDKANAD